MWQLLFFAAVAGSTAYATTKHFLTPKNRSNTNTKIIHPQPQSLNREEEGVFTFSASQDGSHTRSRPDKNRVEQRFSAAQRKGGTGRKLHFCLKKRKIITNTKSVAAKPAFPSSNDNSIFGWGLGFGLMYMMSAGKAEITKLSKALDEAAKVVQELKSELSRTKSLHNHQILDSAGDIDKVNYRENSGKQDELLLKKTNSEPKATNVKNWSPTVNDGGECGSSTLTEEPDPQVLKMDQLEAELEVELQKISGCTIDSPCNGEIENEGCHGSGTDHQNFNSSLSHGVSASELNQKLSHLLIKQQENQITELESELQLALSNLHHKEAELQALKQCVRQLTELSPSAVSDDEAQALTDPKGNNDLDKNNVDSGSRQSVVGVKRPIDSELRSCYM